MVDHLSLSFSLYPDTMFFVSVLPALACTNTNTMESCAVSLSIERGECSCAMHVQQPQSRRPRGSFVRVWPGPGRDWLTEYRWWFVLLGLLFAGMDISGINRMMFTIDIHCLCWFIILESFIFSFFFFFFCLFVLKRGEGFSQKFKFECYN